MVVIEVPIMLSVADDLLIDRVGLRVVGVEIIGNGSSNETE